MLFPEPKRFLSEIEILTTDTETVPVSLEVNSPFSFQGWKIYQVSYDDELGRWSDT
jgi:cytochrome c biogenesis protein ResB